VEQELLIVSEQLSSPGFSGTGTTYRLVSVICVKDTCTLISYERGKKDLIVISANGIFYTDIQ
jgi:hypothetical protein